jgi:tetratricopeptide (TPR) repeat protein
MDHPSFRSAVPLPPVSSGCQDGFAILGKKQALDCFAQALSIRRSMEHRLGLGRTLKNLGAFYCSYGENEKALQCLEEALNISREVGDHPGEGMTLNNLGVVYNSLRQQERAREFLKRALNVRRELGDRWGEGETLYEIGKLYFEQQSYGVALACFLLAQNIQAAVQSPGRNKTQSSIEAFHGLVGDEQFTTLLASVESQAQQIVDQALGDSKRFSD